MTRRQNTTT